MTTKMAAVARQFWPVDHLSNPDSGSQVTPGSLFRPPIVFEHSVPSADVDRDLYPEEMALVRNAVDRRRQEFAAGRKCARLAMMRLGVSPAALLARDDRSAAWPAELRGSISHTKGFCGVAVARSRDIAGLGFDVEPAEPLPPDVWRVVLTGNERAALSQLGPEEGGRLARLAFTAKEAYYKCHHSAGGGWLDFHDVELSIVADRIVGIAALRPLPGEVARVETRCAMIGSHLCAAVVMLPRSGIPTVYC